MITTVYLLIVSGNAVDYHCIPAKCQRSRLCSWGLGIIIIVNVT